MPGGGRGRGGGQGRVGALLALSWGLGSVSRSALFPQTPNHTPAPPKKVLKLYFVGVASPLPRYRVDMATLFCFDAATRLMTRPDVVTVGDDIRDPVLRITWVVGGAAGLVKGEAWGRAGPFLGEGRGARVSRGLGGGSGGEGRRLCFQRHVRLIRGLGRREFKPLILDP